MVISFEVDESVNQEDIVFQDDDVIDGFQITRSTQEDISSIFKMRNPLINAISESLIPE